MTEPPLSDAGLPPPGRFVRRAAVAQPPPRSARGGRNWPAMTCGESADADEWAGIVNDEGQAIGANRNRRMRAEAPDQALVDRRGGVAVGAGENCHTRDVNRTSRSLRRTCKSRQRHALMLRSNWHAICPSRRGGPAVGRIHHTRSGGGRLHRVVREHLQTFLAEAAHLRDGEGVPRLSRRRSSRS